MLNPRAATVTALAAFASAIPGQETLAPERFAAVREFAAEQIADGNTPALSIAVLDDNRVVWAEGFGTADIARARPATSHTIYRLASISKPFTATAIMQLVDRDRLALDDPANRWLDAKLVAYRGRSEDITLRRLLNHTSGMPTHWNFFYAGERPPQRPDSIRAYGFAGYVPGTRTNYSNFAFGVLDHIVARRSGTTFRDWLQRELCRPLGMISTDVGIAPGRDAHAAVGYHRDGDAWQAVRDYGFDHDGASAVRSSARDLIEFARLQIGRGAVGSTRVLSSESALAMREPRALHTAGSRFGIGWSVARERGELVLQHSGGMPGVSTMLKVWPERGDAMCVLTNSGNRRPTNQLTRRITEILLADAEGPGSERSQAPARDLVAAPKAGSYRGQLAHPDGALPMQLEILDDGSVRVRIDGDRLDATADATPDGWVVRLRHDLPVGHGAVHADAITLQLQPDDDGVSGIAYANADSTCRLPFWVQLARVEHPKPDKTLRVASYNVLVGFRDHSVGRFLPGAQRLQQVSAWLAAEQPDVVALQEMNGYDDRRLRGLARAWGHDHVAMLKEDGYPVALTSNRPIEVAARHRDGLHHGMLHARTNDLDFVVVHFAPMPGVPRKVAECERALACYRQASAEGRDAIVLGDCNSIHPDDVDHYSAAARERYAKWRYLLVDGKPAEFAIGSLLDAGAVDTLLATGSRPQHLPLPRIDFILAAPRLAARCSAARWLCDERLLRWSDHPPVIADFGPAR